MGLNIKNADVERLATEVAELAHESKTEAIRVALIERKTRLTAVRPEADRRASVLRYLERSVWPHIAPEALGKPVSKQEIEELLGF